MPKVKIVAKSSAKSAKSSKEGKRPVGRTTGVNLKKTWGIAIAKGMKEKLTDEQIMKFMQKEFPENKSKQLHDVRGIPQARRHYNQGLLTDGVPKVQAVAWGSDGKPAGRQRAEKVVKEKKGKKKEGKQTGSKFRKLAQRD